MRSHQGKMGSVCPQTTLKHVIPARPIHQQKTGQQGQEIRSPGRKTFCLLLFRNHKAACDSCSAQNCAKHGYGCTIFQIISNITKQNIFNFYTAQLDILSIWVSFSNPCVMICWSISLKLFAFCCGDITCITQLLYIISVELHWEGIRFTCSRFMNEW